MKTLILLVASIALLVGCGADDAAKTIADKLDPGIGGGPNSGADNGDNNTNLGQKGLFTKSAGAVNSPNTVHGLWESNELEVDTPAGVFKLQMRMEIGLDRVMTTSYCRLGAQKAYATVWAKARTVGENVEILENVEDTVKVGGLDCTASIEKGTMEASEINNGVVGDQNFYLTKIRD